MCPLIGHLNTSFPSDKDITSDFNEWLSFKRLAIIGEIYTGNSWKPYNALKSIITDRTVQVNQKYIRQFHIDNWCHVYACSNSINALKISNEDRRWLIPIVSEEPWPKEKFVEFYHWIKTGGLNYIKYWADTFPEYVNPGEISPESERKNMMIELSRSDAQLEAKRLGAIISEADEPVAIFTWDLKTWLRNDMRLKVFESPVDLVTQLEAGGLIKYPHRIVFEGSGQYIAFNLKCLEQISGLTKNEQVVKLKEFRKKPYNFLSSAEKSIDTGYQPPDSLYDGIDD